jgi:hypothetical protein
LLTLLLSLAVAIHATGFKVAMKFISKRKIATPE